MYKIFKNNFEIIDDTLSTIIDQMINKKITIDNITDSKFPYRHISCLLCGRTKYYQKCNHRRKFD